ncbi:IS3 family transposase [Saccharopolyspora elongata]|uniref:IS3 family transposase n=1 Tax=Saccharopolyspora elongata TaxID=2530387 RepID=A0A4V2YJY0_9PSEU|nr:IS3 family transposase [Saccharopolyspora elongata]
MTHRYRFISAHRAVYGVQRLCRVLEVARSGFYAWLGRGPARQARAAEEAELVEAIVEIHTGSQGTYGSPRVTAELRSAGRPVNHKRIERLMREQEVVGRHQRRRKRTTIPDAAAPPVADLVGRDFAARGLDQRWCGDITYLPIAGGEYLYLATVIDICSRRLIGWSIADHLRADLVCDALDAAVRARGGGVEDVIFHSDRGTQYTSASFAAVCDRHGVHRSMGRVGSSYDNALAEAFFATLKRELLHHGRTVWGSEAEARRQVFRWIAFHNHRRRHSALNYLSPTDYEHRLTSTTVQDLAA